MKRSYLYIVSLLSFSSLMCGCATNATLGGKMIPERGDRSSASQLIKNDFDRMADVELYENSQSLRTLMTKLYKRNPHELAKSTSDPIERMVN
jgi:hypothetical protein